MFEIVAYAPRHADELMALIRREGEDWKVYWEEPNATRYRAFFERSILYLALSDGHICGYIRCIEDALYIYLCDLLVDRAYRGNGLGERMIRRLLRDHPDRDVYVMSGNDGYYDRLGARKEGSVYLLKI